MELSPICKKEYPALRALYHSAFPVAERMPLSRFFALQKKGQAEILVLRTGGAFAGLMIVTFAPGYALLNYFAVEPDCRSMGLGSRALPALQQRYPNRQVVLEVEPPDHTAPNARQRQRRLDFYAKKRLSPLQLTGAAVRRGTGCAHARRTGTGFCRLSRVLSPDLWPSGAPFCAKAPIKRRRAKFSLYFGRGWCRIVADFQIQ